MPKYKVYAKYQIGTWVYNHECIIDAESENALFSKVTHLSSKNVITYHHRELHEHEKRKLEDGWNDSE
jgi:hypothetical protein